MEDGRRRMEDPMNDRMVMTLRQMSHIPTPVSVHLICCLLFVCCLLFICWLDSEVGEVKRD